jgi:ABC-2 type transport system permease protein
MLVGQPVLFLVLFVSVFGGTLGDGLPGAGTENPAATAANPAATAAIEGGRAGYLHFLVPGILVMAIASVALGTAVSMAMDNTSGIIARFRTMAIAPSSVLTGHVLGAMVQSAIAVVVSAAVAVAMGYRPDVGAVDMLVATAVLALLALALTWLTVYFGLAAKSVETASNTPMFLVILPFLGSGFVPTDSMPAGLRWFADHQPFTYAIDAVRGLLDGAGNGTDIGISIAWCVALTGLGWALAVRKYAAERTG